MYHEHFGFQQDPFNITPDSAFLFPSRRHREAMAALMYGIEQRKGFIALTGEIGSGKTTICRALLKELDRESIRVALILNPQLNDLELLQAINAEYGIDSASDSKRALLDTLNKFLLDQYEQDHNCVLIVDESQRLSPDALEQIRLISNLELESTKLIQIALVGQPELDDLLHLPELEQLNQRIMVRYHIDPLNADEMGEYIEHRLSVANPDHKVKFHKRALKVIFDHTGGVPRRVNVVCDRALLVTYVAGAFEITEERGRQAIAETTSKRASKRTAKSGEDARRSMGATTLRGSDVYLPPGTEAEPQPSTNSPERRSSGGVLVFAGCLLVAGAIIYAAIQFSDGRPSVAFQSSPDDVLPNARPSRSDAAQVAQIPADSTASADQPAQEPPGVAPTPGSTELVSATATPTPSPTPRALSFQPIGGPTPTSSPTPEPTPTQTPAPTPPDETQIVEVIPAPVGEEPPAEIDLTEESVVDATDIEVAEATGDPSSEQAISAPEEEATGVVLAPDPEVELAEQADAVGEEPITSAALATFAYDETGVLRVDRPELTYAGSVLTWVSLTQGQQLDAAELRELQEMDAATIARFELTKGAPPFFLREARVPGVMAMLSNDHLPALIQVDRRATSFGPWAVLLERVDGEVILADPIRGRILVDESEVDETLAAVLFIYPDPEGITDLTANDSGVRVQALQRRLSQLGLLDAAPTGVFDSRTRQALEKYRQFKRLPGGIDIDPVLAVSLIGDTSS